LLGAGGDVKGDLGLEAVVHGLLGDARAPGHVFVGRVGAATDEAHPDVQRPAGLLGVLAQLVDGVGQVGGEGAVHVGLQGVKVDLNHLYETRRILDFIV